MLSEHLQQLYDVRSVDDEEAIYAKIRDVANQDRDAFIEEVRQLPLDEYSLLHDIYEALSYEAAAWQGFFLEELDRILALAQSSPNPAQVLSPLDEFFLLSLEEDDQLHQSIQDRLYDNLDDGHVLVRRKCVVLLGDFVGPRDFKELDKLEKITQADPDWRVRYLAYQALEDVHPKRARRVKLPLWIRLRARFSGMDLA